MTKMIVNIEKHADIRNIVATLKLLEGVGEIKVQKNVDNECIPGLPYTYDERIADIKIAEENYATGLTVSSEELKNRISVW